jgi:hypothetical protein
MMLSSKILATIPWGKAKKNHPTRGFFQNHEPNDIGPKSRN